MFSYIKGKVISAENGILVLECNNVGFELLASNSAIVNFSSKREEVKVYTYLAVREDGVSLYGFYSLEEKAMFLKLISVSGVGPKLAFSVLSGISLGDFAMAIITKDVKTLSKIKGLGKKTAERIILELKETVSISDTDGEIDYSDIDTPNVTDRDTADAIMALRTLGISLGEAQRAVNKAKKAVPNGTIEELIAQALKSID